MDVILSTSYEQVFRSQKHLLKYCILFNTLYNARIYVESVAAETVLRENKKKTNNFLLLRVRSRFFKTRHTGCSQDGGNLPRASNSKPSGDTGSSLQQRVTVLKAIETCTRYDGGLGGIRESDADRWTILPQPLIEPDPASRTDKPQEPRTPSPSYISIGNPYNLQDFAQLIFTIEDEDEIREKVESIGGMMEGNGSTPRKPLCNICFVHYKFHHDLTEDRTRVALTKGQHASTVATDTAD
ncbi:hypothetical protein ANN_19452 [Periplaneta americana]|uniref:Uncharacterized protein n=1 Tax=Periplaneta americana TaxID=6978 RepID=A0ABQ8SAF0_PERAM|nr:hypothetical protein ANN_19452 [Periplaneta americana]